MSLNPAAIREWVERLARVLERPAPDNPDAAAAVREAFPGVGNPDEQPLPAGYVAAAVGQALDGLTPGCDDPGLGVRQRVVLRELCRELRKPFAAHHLADPGTAEEFRVWLQDHVLTAFAGPPPPKPLDDLQALVDAIPLFGKAGTVVRAICDGGGRVPLRNLALACRWANPDDNWNSACRRLNVKLRPHGWRLARRGGHAVAVRVAAIGSQKTPKRP